MIRKFLTNLAGMWVTDRFHVDIRIESNGLQ